MDFLKEYLGDELYAQVEAKLKGNEKVKLANLKSGEYVSKLKYDEEVGKVTTANTQIATLTGEIDKFKQGDDPIKLKNDMQALQTKYDADVVKVKKESAVKEFLAGKGVKHTDLLLNQFDLDTVEIDEKGKVKEKGITDQFKVVAEKYADLIPAEDKDDEGDDGSDYHYEPGDGKHGASGGGSADFAKIINDNRLIKEG